MGARDEGFWSRALVFCGWAEGDAPERGAAKGLRGTAPRSAGTNARETQNPGHRRDSRRPSEELSPLRSPEIVFWRTRFLPGVRGGGEGMKVEDC